MGISADVIDVLLLSNYPVMLLGLRQLIDGTTGIRVVAEAPSAEDAVRLIQTTSVDVVIVDADGPEVALEAVATLIEACACRALVFTACTDPDVFVRAIELGASGVVGKEQAPELLLRAIRKVDAGELWLDRAKTASVVSRAMHRRRDPEAIKIASLTKREREIVQKVGEGLRNSVIGGQLFISEATVRNHLTSILGKLDLADRFELAVYAYRHQLVSATRHPGPNHPVEEPRQVTAQAETVRP